MKYLLKIVVILSLISIFTGCGSSEDESSESSSVSNVEAIDESKYENIDSSTEVNREVVENIPVSLEDNSTTNDNFDDINNSSIVKNETLETLGKNKANSSSIPFPYMATDMELNDKYIPPVLGE